MLTVTDETGTTTRTYDELGRVLTKHVPNIGTITFTYDITDGMYPGCSSIRSRDPKGNITQKVYDQAGRLKEVMVGNDRTTYTYYDNGNRERIIYSNGSIEEYTYYANNQIKTLINRKSDGSVMDSYTYTYDKVGNQLTKQEIINGINKGTTTYTYDVLNRLSTVSEANARNTTYTYDLAGNRQTETVVMTDTATKITYTTVNSYVYDSANRLTSISSKVNNVLATVTDYTYDNNGNQLTKIVSTYANGTVTSKVTALTNTYDVHNQLIRANTDDGTVVNSIYNAEGYRVGKKVNGVWTYYLYEADKVVLEVNDDGTQKAWNVYGTNLLMREVGSESYYYFYNGHADVTALLDASNGTVVGTYYYDAFGNILEHAGIDSNINYSGYQWDKESGLYYLNARFYDSQTARFLQEDTFSGYQNDPLSLNLYTYCANNPITYHDPTGHWFGVDDLIVSGVGAVVGVAGQYIGDVVSNVSEGKSGWDVLKPTSSWETYTGAAVGGAAVGETMLYTANPILAGAAYGGVSTIVGQGLEKATGKNNRSWGEIATNTVGGTVGGVVGGATFMDTGNPILAGAAGGGVATGTSELLQKAIGINDRSFVDIAKDSGKSAITGAIAGGVFGLAGKVTNLGGKTTPENIPNTPKTGGFDWNNVPHYNEVLEQAGVPRTNLELLAKNMGGSQADVLAKNRTQGKVFEQQEFSTFNKTNTNAVEQVTIKTSSGTKTRVDAIGLDGNGNVVINEFKSSVSAPLTPNQKISFPELYNSGGTVVGKGKGIFTGGYEIPSGTEVKIIRPEVK